MKKLGPASSSTPERSGDLAVGLDRQVAIFFIVDALDTKAKGYDVVISFPRKASALGRAIALIKGAKNANAAKKLIDWATSPAMQGLLPSTRSTSFRPPEVKTEASLRVLKARRSSPSTTPTGAKPQAHRRALDRRSPA